ncbi:MAG TPA: hypothetical protein VF765_20520 [Polyangiaceae bacterium]
MTNGNKITKTKKTTATRAGEVLGGMKKRFPNGGQKLTFGGGATTVTVDEAVGNLQEIIDNRAAVTAARGAAKAKVAEENAKLPTLLAFMRALLGFIKFTFGADPEALADFGVEPPKARTPMTAEEKAIAAVKREGTRKARGVIGTRKRAAVKGDVNATLVVTPAAPAATPAAPEPPAPPAVATPTKG